MRKRFSLKGLADFMTSAPAKQRTIIRQYKYPNEDEGRAKIMYYREARDLIAAYHGTGKDARWLEAEALRLESIAALSLGQRRVRLRHNARALREYGRCFGHRQLTVLADLDLALVYGDVVVTVRPDLHVTENDIPKIIKLEFATAPPSAPTIKIITQSLFEAAREGGLPYASNQVLYLDVPRGAEHRGARLGARMKKDIEAACKTISDIWPSI